MLVINSLKYKNLLIIEKKILSCELVNKTMR